MIETAEAEARVGQDCALSWAGRRKVVRVIGVANARAGETPTLVAEDLAMMVGDPATLREEWVAVQAEAIDELRPLGNMTAQELYDFVAGDPPQHVLWVRWQDPPGSRQTRWFARYQSTREACKRNAEAITACSWAIHPAGFDPNEAGL